MLPGPGPGSVLCMIRERHVILKAALHSRLAVLTAASYIIMLYCLIYIVKIFLMLVWRTYNYSYRYLASFPSCCIVYIYIYIHNYDTMIIQVYY